MALWLPQWTSYRAVRVRAQAWSLCCVLRHDTSLLQRLSPPRNINGYLRLVRGTGQKFRTGGGRGQALGLERGKAFPGDVRCNIGLASLPRGEVTLLSLFILYILEVTAGPVIHVDCIRILISSLWQKFANEQTKN